MQSRAGQRGFLRHLCGASIFAIDTINCGSTRYDDGEADQRRTRHPEPGRAHATVDTVAWLDLPHRKGVTSESGAGRLRSAGGRSSPTRRSARRAPRPSSTHPQFDTVDTHSQNPEAHRLSAAARPFVPAYDSGAASASSMGDSATPLLPFKPGRVDPEAWRGSPAAAGLVGRPLFHESGLF